MNSSPAWLIDVYGTVLRVDFDRVYQGLADVAGVPSDMFRDAFGQVMGDVLTCRGAGQKRWLDHTRGLLVHFGFDAMVDEFVLLSEVGFLKPDARIFQFALDRLGVGPESAVFVDDKVSYCRAARALGLSAVHLVRQGRSIGTDSLPGDPPVPTSFADLAPG